MALDHDREHRDLGRRPGQDGQDDEKGASRPGAPRVRPRGEAGRGRARGEERGKPAEEDAGPVPEEPGALEPGLQAEQAPRPQALEAHLRPVAVQRVDDEGADHVVVGGPGGGRGGGAQEEREAAAGAEPGEAEHGQREQEVEEPLPVEEAHREGGKEGGGESRPRREPRRAVLGQPGEEQEEEERGHERLGGPVEEPGGAREREVREVHEEDQPGGRGREAGQGSRHEPPPDGDDRERGEEGARGDEEETSRARSCRTHCASRKSIA